MFLGEGAESCPGGREVLPHRPRDVRRRPQHAEICPSGGRRETSERTPWRHVTRIICYTNISERFSHILACNIMSAFGWLFKCWLHHILFHRALHHSWFDWILWLYFSGSPAGLGTTTTQSAETHLATGEWSVFGVAAVADAGHAAHGERAVQWAAATGGGDEEEEPGIFFDQRRFTVVTLFGCFYWTLPVQHLISYDKSIFCIICG